MTDTQASVVILARDQDVATKFQDNLSETFSHVEFIIVTDTDAMNDEAVRQGIIYIALVDNDDFDAMAMISLLTPSPMLPIILYSEQDFDAVKAMEVGFTDVVIKANFEHLVWLIKRDLSRFNYYKKAINSSSDFYTDFTGVHSRLGFLECIETLNKEIHKPETAILYLQLDNFSWINENLGMAAGDHYLKDIGHVLGNILTKDDYVARYQGGNFVIYVSAEEEKLLKSKTDMVRESVLSMSTEYNDNLISSSASIGVRQFDIEIPLQTLIANAYDASDVAKSGGGDAVHYYRVKTDDSADNQNKNAWNERIKKAFDKDLFVLYFQPIVSIQTDSSPRYEVLLRMEDENHDIISPGTFLPYAERAGLMSDIDRKVIVHSLEKGLAHRQGSGEEPELFIKLSGKSVDDISMPSWIAQTMKETDYPAEKIVFEITESIALHHLVQTRNLCTKLHEINAKVALDHFGTRFRSFKLLESLKVDYIKIDGSLIQHLSYNKSHQTIVKKIVKKAKANDIGLVAESVQEATYLPTIWQYEIPFVQGFFLGVPTDEMTYDFRNLLI